MQKPDAQRGTETAAASGARGGFPCVKDAEYKTGGAVCGRKADAQRGKMRLIELLNCMEKGGRIKIHCPQVNGRYKVFGGTKDEMCELKEELVWAGNVAVVRAAREGLLEVWTR